MNGQEYIYEFVTPSDPITFKACNDKIAFVCAMILGNGKAGCHRHDDNGETNLRTILIFDPDPTKTITKFLGCDLKEFIDRHKNEISRCFESFAYGSIEERQTFDDAISAITDQENLEKFKKRHEDRNRSSMNEWVAYAWELGERYRNEI